MHQVFTIGHSTHAIDVFVGLLKRNGVTQLIDVRTIPRSRHNPQFEQTALEKSLPAAGIAYRHMKALGGLRPKIKGSVNMGWHNESFRNYADYMQTDEFKQALRELIELSNQVPTVIMCAEAVPWRCHRSLIADALTVQGVTVKEIIGETEPKTHELTSFAHVRGTEITYPAPATER